jgi:hypothetical protein
MLLTILDDIISSARTTHSARLLPNETHGWEVSWLPGRRLNRNAAITAVLLADVTATVDIHPGHRLWVHVEGWAAELGLTAHDVLAMTIPEPVWTGADMSATSADPEAAA